MAFSDKHPESLYEKTGGGQRKISSFAKFRIGVLIFFILFVVGILAVYRFFAPPEGDSYSPPSPVHPLPSGFSGSIDCPPFDGNIPPDRVSFNISNSTQNEVVLTGVRVIVRYSMSERDMYCVLEKPQKIKPSSVTRLVLGRGAEEIWLGDEIQTEIRRYKMTAGSRIRFIFEGKNSQDKDFSLELQHKQ